MTSLIQAIGHRIIGTVEEVSADRISVLLDPDAPPGRQRSTPASPAGFPRVNGYVLIPNEDRRHRLHHFLSADPAARLPEAKRGRSRTSALSICRSRRGS